MEGGRGRDLGEGDDDGVKMVSRAYVLRAAKNFCVYEKGLNPPLIWGLRTARTRKPNSRAIVTSLLHAVRRGRTRTPA